jgi:KaiC/GvpD/RAD55 family RecA-like ATPase
MALMKYGRLPDTSLTVVCARAKTGKSYFMLNCALLAALDSGMPVLYLDMELTRRELFERAAAMVVGVHENDIASGRCVNGPKAESVKRATHRLKSLGKRFLYRRIAGCSPEQIEAEIKAFRRTLNTVYVTDPLTGTQYGLTEPAPIIYDWLRLADVGGLKQAQETQLLGQQVAMPKQAGSDAGIPIIAAAQVNRESIGCSAEDFDQNAERFISGSDRISHFCSCLAVLRNVSPDEAVDIAGAFGSRLGRTGENALAYNQVLRVQLNRDGDSHRSIPLYFAKGFGTMQDVSNFRQEERLLTVAEWMAMPKRERRATSWEMKYIAFLACGPGSLRDLPHGRIPRSSCSSPHSSPISTSLCFQTR